MNMFSCNSQASVDILFYTLLLVKFVKVNENNKLFFLATIKIWQAFLRTVSYSKLSAPSGNGLNSEFSKL